MFKTFSGKFFAIYALTTVVIFLLLFGMLSQILTEHFISGKYRTMTSNSETIATEFKDTFIDQSMSASDFQYQVRTMAYHTQTNIMVINNSNLVVFDSETSSSSTLGTTVNHDFIQRALEGEVVNTIDDFEPFENERAIIVSRPIIFDSDTLAAIVIYAPYPSVKQDITYVYNLILICFAVIIFVTFISTYAFSRSISQTFKSFNSTAKQIASGNFSSRIEQADFSNEVAELGESMNYMAEELEKLEDLRKDFIANISHDFRSPLTSIRGYAQALMDGTIPHEKQEKYLTIIVNESDRLTKLTNDILLLTKMENEVLKPEREDFDLHETIRNILLQFEGKILAKNISMTLLIEKQEIVVNADFNQIQRTITNLLDNAIKFCSNEDEITIETTREGRKVMVSIKDTGPGISEDELKNIWTRFHKADRSRGKDKKGVGLGLSIVREIIRAHDESIEVYSQLGKGTTFVFSLLIADSDL